MNSDEQISNVVSLNDCKKATKRWLGDSDFTVLEYKAEPMGAVCGFLGIHMKLTVTVLHDSQKKVLNFFAKGFPLQESHRQYVSSLRAFTKEAFMYGTVIREMKHVVPEIRLPFPACYLADSQLVVMEDLATSGYQLVDKKVALDFDHCVAVIKAFATLHATSVALEKKMGKPLNQVYDFFESLFNDSEGHLGCAWAESGYKTFLAICSLLPDYSDFAKNDREKIRKVWDTVWGLVKASTDHLNVVCHGDLWSNNLLFKYSHTNAISDVKFVDLQIGRYAPPATDISLFLHTTTTRAMREKNLEKFLAVYWRTFTSTLHSVDVKLPEYSYSDFQQSYKEFSNFGRIASILYLPFALIDDSAAEEMVDPSSADGFLNMFTGDRSPTICSFFRKNSLYRERLTDNVVDLLEQCMPK